MRTISQCSLVGFFVKESDSKTRHTSTRLSVDSSIILNLRDNRMLIFWYSELFCSRPLRIRCFSAIRPVLLGVGVSHSYQCTGALLMSFVASPPHPGAFSERKERTGGAWEGVASPPSFGPWCPTRGNRWGRWSGRLFRTFRMFLRIVD